MIRIKKQPTAPKKLREAGVKETKKLKTAYDAAPAKYKAGTKTFDDFKGSIYGDKAVKRMLRRAQHDKCCFCESKVSHIAYGDVEHFRPKAGYCQKKGNPLGKPGYYWLAYDWENLFFSCQLCNQRYKKNLFPLKNPNDRAVCHHDAIDDEEPLFLNPAEDDPENHIGFREEYPYAIGSGARARTTIKQLGLKREGLAEFRKELLAKLKGLIDCYQLLIRRFPTGTRPQDVQDQVSELQRLLKEAIDPKAQYSAMAKAAVGNSLED